MKIHGTQKQPRLAGCRNGRLTLLACFTHSAPDPRGAPRSSFPELLESARLPSPASASREASPGRKVGALRGSRDPPGTSEHLTQDHWPQDWALRHSCSDGGYRRRWA